MKYVLIAVALVALWLWLRRKVTPPAARAAIEARAVLGVGLRADADTIRAAHRRLVADAHPDRGGSAELTRRLNNARDLLLGQLANGTREPQ